MPDPSTQTLIVPVRFTIGALEQIGIGSLKQPWINSENGPLQFELDVGAGLGSTLIEAEVHDTDTGRRLYARADIRDLAQQVFGTLAKNLDAGADTSPAGDH